MAHCLSCRKEFKIPNYFEKAGRGKYCSRECYWESLKEKTQPQLNSKKTREKIGKKLKGHLVLEATREKIRRKLRTGKFIKCKICEKEFYVNPTMIKRRYKCCSKECSATSRKGTKMSLQQKVSISKTLREKPGKRRTGLRKRIRLSYKWKIWRDTIFKQDNFICQDCGLQSKKGFGKRVRLEAHHNHESFASLLDRLKITTMEQALECEELWNATGITLCKQCHLLRHRNGLS